MRATVLEGEPIYQDVYLSDGEKLSGTKIHDLCVPAPDRRASCLIFEAAPMITLYDYELSGNCYKLRLLLSFLKIEYKTDPVEFYPGQRAQVGVVLEINPLSQLPVIDDDGFVLRDAQAILVYLASSYDPSGLWYPRSEPKLLGEIGQWLAFADGITATASAARLHDGLFYELDAVAGACGRASSFSYSRRASLVSGTGGSELDLQCGPSNDRRYCLFSLHHVV